MQSTVEIPDLVKTNMIYFVTTGVRNDQNTLSIRGKSWYVANNNAKQP